MITIEQLSEKNFHDYETLTSCESGGGCYCSFWHQKWDSLKEYDAQKKEHPEKNRNTVFEKMQSNFHVGVLAYNEKKELMAWISVGPVDEFYWSVPRAAKLGAKSEIAGVMCFTVAPAFRGKGVAKEILSALANYGRSKNWKAIEGYPFDMKVVEEHGQGALWPGLEKNFAAAGFEKLEEHWMSKPQATRWIYRLSLS